MKIPSIDQYNKEKKMFTDLLGADFESLSQEDQYKHLVSSVFPKFEEKLKEDYNKSIKDPEMVFHFSFSSRTVYGFKIKQSKFKTEHELCNFLEEPSYCDFVEQNESRYGVHDYSVSPNPSVLSIGYTSYEITSRNHLKVMKNFKDFFENYFGVGSTGEICKIDNKVFAFGDSLAIWNNLK